MHVITRKRLLEFGASHPDAARPLDDWFRVMKAMTFGSPAQLKRVFASASLLGGGLTVFNVGGNKYRLVVTMRYDMGKVFIRRVLMHSDYNRHSGRGTL